MSLALRFIPRVKGTLRVHKPINSVLRAYCGKNKYHWATFAKLAQWSMRSTPRKDRNNKSPYEIVTGLKPQGPFDSVFEKFSPDKQTPSVYVNQLNKYLGKIRDHIALQLDAEYQKRQAKIAGGRSLKMPQVGDLVFVRSTPDAVARQIDSKKKGEELMSQRLLPYADPKLYRVSKVTDFGHFILEDPATGRLTNNHKDAVPSDRLILYEDLPPQEQPLNPDDEIWIEIKSNEVGQSNMWLQRKIVAQCETGEVRVCDKNGNDSRIIELANYDYHFIKPPRSTEAATSVGKSNLPSGANDEVELGGDSDSDADSAFTLTEDEEAFLESHLAHGLGDNDNGLEFDEQETPMYDPDLGISES